MGCKFSNARTKKLQTAPSRRRHLDKHPLIIERTVNLPADVEIIQEYVDTGKGHLISTKCYRHKSQTPKGMIFYCQGYSSYADWTDMDVALEWVNRGFIVVTHDHYGHGRSDGDWLTNPVMSHDTYVDDALFICERAKRKFTPIEFLQKQQKFHYFLLGHSMGGAVAIEISKRYTSSRYCQSVQKALGKDIYPESSSRANGTDHVPEQKVVDEKSPLKLNDSVGDFKLNDEEMISNDYAPSAVLKHCLCAEANDHLFGWDGMILSAPMVKIKDEMKPPAFLFPIAERIQSVCPDARIIPTTLKVGALTHDEHYLDFINKSPLLYTDKPALRTGLVLLKFTEHLEREMDKVMIPMLLLHGEEDQITDPEMSQILYDRCSCRDKEIEIVKGAWHALLLDSCRNEVSDKIDDWIRQRCGPCGDQSS